MKARVLYRAVRDGVLDIIKGVEPGDRLPGQVELARRFGCNHLTVRRALRDLEEEGTIVRVQGKGTFVRKRRRPERMATVAVLAPSPWGAVETRGLLVDGIFDGVVRDRIRISLSVFPETRRGLRDIVSATKPDGVMAVYPRAAHMPWLGDLHDDGYAVMLVNRVIADPRFNYVSTDHEGGAFALTRALIARGRRAVAVAGLSGACHARQRYAGYLRALAAAGIAPDRKLIASVNGGRSGERALAEMADGLRRVLDARRPTALFVVGGTYLRRAVEVLRERSLAVPSDVEVATFDEAEDAPLRTAVHEAVQPMEEMGRTAVGELRRIIEGSRASCRIVLPPEIRLKGPPGPDTASGGASG